MGEEEEVVMESCGGESEDYEARDTRLSRCCRGPGIRYLGSGRMSYPLLVGDKTCDQRRFVQYSPYRYYLSVLSEVKLYFSELEPLTSSFCAAHLREIRLQLYTSLPRR